MRPPLIAIIAFTALTFTASENGSGQSRCENYALTQSFVTDPPLVGPDGVLLVGDLNGNGRDDVLVGDFHRGAARVVVYTSAEDGSPGGPITVFTGESPTSARWNSNHGRIYHSDNDFIFFGQNNQTHDVVAYRKLKGHGSFVGYLLHQPRRGHASAPAAIDVNHDGFLDVVALGGDGRSLYVWYGSPNGGFSEPQLYQENAVSDPWRALVSAGHFARQETTAIAVVEFPRHSNVKITVYVPRPERNAIGVVPSCVLPPSFGKVALDILTIPPRYDGGTPMTVLVGQSAPGSPVNATDVSLPLMKDATCLFSLFNSEVARPNVAYGDFAKGIDLFANGGTFLSYTVAHLDGAYPQWQKHQIGIGQAVMAVAVGDFNGDGVPDLVALGGDRRLHYFLGKCSKTGN
jgi:hypothetical protein